MNNKIFVKDSSRLEEKNSKFNVGIDLKAVSVDIKGQTVNGFYNSIDYIEYDTGIFLDPLRKNEDSNSLVYSLVYPRSSISNKNLILCNSVGVIDPNYRDSIKIRFKYIIQPKDIKLFNDFVTIDLDVSKIYRIGDKIAQIVFSKTIPYEIQYVSELAKSDRSGGFGSTGE